MQRVCFILQVRSDRIDEYRERHRNVWSDMRDALSAAGWRNYSLFLREDGLLIGYLECDDFDAARSAMAATEVNARWQSTVRDLLEATVDANPDERMRPLDEVFHLD